MLVGLKVVLFWGEGLEEEAAEPGVDFGKTARAEHAPGRESWIVLYCGH